MARRSNKQSPQDIPQLDNAWLLIIHAMRSWVETEDEEIVRPYALVALNSTGLMQNIDMQQSEPEPADVLAFIHAAINRSEPSMKITPHRPKRILFEGAELEEALRPALTELGIASTITERDPGVTQMLREMDAQSSEGALDIPGLLSVAGVTPAFLVELFSAAAEFYRFAPWSLLQDTDMFAIQVAGDPRERIVSIIGAAEMEYGLAVYETWADVLNLFQESATVEERIAPGGSHLFSFGPMHEVPFDDLDAIEEHDLEVADEDAFPAPMIFFPDERVERPNLADLLWYEAALWALPILMEDELKEDDAGEFLPTTATLTVATSRGDVAVTIRYPAGTLPGMAGSPMDMKRLMDVFMAELEQEGEDEEDD